MLTNADMLLIIASVIAYCVHMHYQEGYPGTVHPADVVVIQTTSHSFFASAREAWGGGGGAAVAKGVRNWTEHWQVRLPKRCTGN